MNMSITHPYTWSWYMTTRKEAIDWDDKVNTAKGRVYITTRQRGDIPGCIPEASPLSKDQKFMDKYHLGPNDPQWIFELIAEGLREQAEKGKARTGG